MEDSNDAVNNNNSSMNGMIDDSKIEQGIKGYGACSPELFL